MLKLAAFFLRRSMHEFLAKPSPRHASTSGAILLELLAKLPLRVLYVLTPAIYFWLYRIWRFRTEIVRENLKNSFPDKSDAERGRIARDFYRNSSEVLVEAIKAHTMSRDEIARRVTIVNREIVQTCADQGQSVILLAAHQCNWEWLLLASSISFPNGVDAVYKPLHDKRVESFMFSTRARFGARPIPAREFFSEIVKRKGKPRCYAMVADQTPLADEEKYWTRFLNQDSAFFVGADKIAAITGSPVIFVAIRRLRRGYYEATLKLIAEPPYAGDANEVIERYVAEVERQIEEHPADWFWVHRKWKYKKPLYA